MGKRAKKAVNVGIIGCGGIARGKHFRELSEVPQARLVACADVDFDRARGLAQLAGAGFWTDDHRQLLARNDVDAVVVATPHPSHVAIGLDVLKAGKHLLLQKPMATTNRDAARMVRASENSDRIVLVLPYLFAPWLCGVKKLLDQNAIGQLRMVRSRVAHGIDHRAKSWFAQEQVAGGGALFDMGVYAAWLLVYWLGPVREVSAIFTNPTGGATVEQNAALLLRFESGPIGVLETSWQQQATKDGHVFYGMKGTIHAGHGKVEIFRSDSRKPRRGARWQEVRLPKRVPMPLNVKQHWVDCILRGRKPLSTVKRGRHIVEILCAGYKSVATGQRIPVRSDC